MGNIHQLIRCHGIDEVRARIHHSGVKPDDIKNELVCANIAAAMLSEENSRLGFTHSGFCLTSLPHKNTKELVWERKGHKITLLVQSGLERDKSPVGLPFGAKARLILLYLQSQAVRTGNPRVELGACMAQWLARMGLEDGGATRAEVRRQAHRISACILTFFYESDQNAARYNGAFVESEVTFRSPKHQEQGELFPDEVELNQTFYRLLKEHSVPLSEIALRHIAGKSQAIDVYIWLAYRLHSLSKPVTIHWPAVFAQFGGAYKNMYQFKPEFVRALKLALAVYPEAAVDIDANCLTLRPSRPPVPPTVVYISM